MKTLGSVDGNATSAADLVKRPADISVPENQEMLNLALRLTEQFGRKLWSKQVEN